MYSLNCLLLASFSRMEAERCTMNDLLMRTSVRIQGRMSRLSPMAISTVVGKPFAINSIERKAESSTMSRWLEMKV